jgi:DNA-binding Lrp family transcriptional regulator
MSDLKPLDHGILFELMKNARRSDRELAKILGVSQPTITRRRSSLEKSGLIENYTLIPRWAKLGYSLMAIILVRVRVGTSGNHEARYQEVFRRGAEWLTSQPNILMAGGCRGTGVESFMISIHKTYADFDEFMNDCRLKLGDLLEIVQFIIVNLAGREVLKPLNPAYLAEAEAK